MSKSEFQQYKFLNKLNNKINSKYPTKDQVYKDEIFYDEQGNRLTGKALEDRQAEVYANFMLDSSFYRNYVDFTKNTNIIGSVYKDTDTKLYPHPNGYKETYSAILPFFEQMIQENVNIYDPSKKTNPGHKFIKSVIEYNQGVNYNLMNAKANSSIDTMLKTFNNFKNVNEFYTFDLETLSGLGETGNQELDKIQELSFRKYRKVGDSVEEIVEDRIETLVGISEQEFKYYEDILINSKDKMKNVQKYKVIAERFGKLGNESYTTFDIMDKETGLATIKTFAPDDPENLSDINILKGLKKARKIGEMQEEAAKKTGGLQLWQLKLFEGINAINNNFIAGYNSTQFDFEKLNQQSARVWSGLNNQQKSYIANMMKLEKGQIPTVAPKANNYIDLFDVMRVSASYNGASYLYSNSELEVLNKDNLTLLKQESIRRLLPEHLLKELDNVTAAHSAGADVAVLAYLLNGGVYADAIDTIIKNKSNVMGNVSTNSLFMAKGSPQFSERSGKNPLNFIYDQASDTVRFSNGYAITKEQGTPTVQYFGKYGKNRGIKRNTAYGISFMGEYEMTDEWTKEIGKIHQDYAQGKLWSLSLTSIMPDSMPGIDRNNTIPDETVNYLFTSKEAMEGFISSNLDLIAQYDQKLEKLTMPFEKDAMQEILDRYSINTIVNGEISTNRQDAETITEEGINEFLATVLNKSATDKLNDSATNWAKSNSYSNTEKFLNLKKELEENGVTNVSNQIAVLSKLTNQSKIDITPYVNMSSKTASLISSGQPITFSYQELIEKAGFVNKKTESNYMYDSTLSSMINSWRYMDSKSSLLEKVMMEVNSYEGASSAKKQIVFDELMNALKESASISTINLDEEPVEIYGKDLNYFEFNLPGFFKPKKGTMADVSDESNILRVDLNEGSEYGLINNLLERRLGYIDDKADFKNVYGKNEIVNLIKELNSSKEYKGMFKSLIAGPDRETANDKIINKLRDDRDVLKNKYRNTIYNASSNIYERIINSENALKENSSEIKTLEDLRNNVKILRKKQASLLEQKRVAEENFINSINNSYDKDVSQIFEQIKDPKMKQYYYDKKESIAMAKKNINKNDKIIQYNKQIKEIKQAIASEKKSYKTSRNEYKKNLLQELKNTYEATVNNYQINKYDKNDKKILNYRRQELAKQIKNIEKHPDLINFDNEYELKINNFNSQLNEITSSKNSHKKEMLEEYNNQYNSILEEINQKINMPGVAAKNTAIELKNKKANMYLSPEIKEILLALNETSEELDLAHGELFSKLDGLKEFSNEHYNNLINQAGEYRNQIENVEKQINTRFGALIDENDGTWSPINSNISASALGNMFIQTLKSIRRNNPTKGYIKSPTRTFVLGEDNLLNRVDDSLFESVAKTVKENMSNYIEIDGSKDDDISKAARKLVDDILMPTVKDKDGNIITNLDEIVRFAEKTFGYNKPTAKAFKTSLEMIRDEHIKGYENIIGAVTKHGGKIGYNTATKEIEMLMGEEAYKLNLPRTVYTNGTLALKIGDQLFGVNFKFNVNKNIKGGYLQESPIKAGTTLGSAYDNLKYLSSSLSHAKNTHNNNSQKKAEAVLRSINGMLADFRTNPVLQHSTTKSRAAWQHVDYDEIITGAAYKLEELENYSGWDKPEIVQVFKDNEKNIKNGYINSEVREAFTREWQDVTKIVLGKGGGTPLEEKDFEEFLIKNTNIFTKENAAAKSVFFLGQYAPTANQRFNEHARPVSTSVDEISYRKSDMDNFIKNNKDLGYIESNSRLVTNATKNGLYFENVGEIANGITFENAMMSEKAFKQAAAKQIDLQISFAIASNNKELLNKLIKVKNELSTINLTEQEKLIDGRVANFLFNATETQNITLLKNFNTDVEIANEKMRKRVTDAAPIVSVKDGEIVFKLREGQYVKHNDPLLATNKYGGGTSTIGVKEDGGFFKAGYFAKETNILATEKELMNFLNANKKDYINPDGTINYYKVEKALASEYRKEFYVENAFLKGTNKGTLDLSEKSMYTSLQSGAGNLNPKVAKALDELGLGESKGKILTDQFINHVANTFNGNKELAQNTGYKDLNELINDINEEKYYKSNFFQQLPGFKGILSIGNDKVPKHKNAGTAMNYLINNIAYTERHRNKNLSVSDSYKKAFELITANKMFQGTNISFDDKTGQIIFEESLNEENEKIITNNVLKFVEDYGIDKESADNPLMIFDGDGNIIGKRYIGTMSASLDYSGTSRWESEIGETSKKIKELRNEIYTSSSSDAEVETKTEELIGLQRKLEAMKGKSKTMKFSSREMDLLELYEYNEGNMDIIKKTLGDDSLYKKIYGGENGVLDGNLKYLKDNNGTKVYGRLLESMVDKIANRATVHGKQYLAAQAAITFNENNDSYTLKALQEEHGFKIISADKLRTAEIENSSFLADNEFRSFGQNVLIDTGNKNQRYIAITPTMFNDSHFSEFGETVENDNVQRAVKGYMRQYERYQQAKYGDENALRGKKLEDVEAMLLSSGEEIKKAMVGGTRAMRKDLEHVYLDRYSYEKASMISIDDSLPYYMFNKSQIEGLSLTEWQNKGVYYDATWHGRSYFKDLGYFDANKLEEYGFTTEDEMMDYLETHGTISIESRTPSIQEGSVNLTRTFLDRQLQTKQSKTMVYTGLARNQDQDGDNIIASELSFVNDDGRTITYADYKKALLDNRGNTLGNAVHAHFEEVTRAQNQRAVLLNPSIYNLQKENYNAETQKALDNASIRKVLLGSANESGDVNAVRLTTQDTAIRNMQIERYNDIQDIVADKIGRDNYKNLSKYNRNVEARNYINAIEDVTKRNSLLAMMDDMDIYTKEMGTLMSKVSQKASIGFINTPLAITRRLASTLGVSADDKKYIQGMARVFEQGIISKKHNVQDEISIAEKFRSSLNAIIYDSNNSDEASEYIKKLIKNKDYQKELWDEMHIFSDVDTSNMTEEQVTDRMVESMSNFRSKIRDNHSEIASLILAENASSVLSGDNVQLVALGTGRSSGVAPRGLTKAGLATQSKYKTTKRLNTQNFEKETREIAKDVGSAIGDAVGQITTSSSGLGIAALGIASAIMAIGYIGGNPSKPADDQAMEESMNDEYQSLQDEDLSIQSLPNGYGTGQGYVININAESDKGQQHAYEAIQKAMQSSIPTDINISMNMNDKTSNISTRLIDKLMAGAL